MAVEIITRDMWHAISPKNEKTLGRIKNVFWMNVRFQSCSSKPECILILSNAQRFHMNSQRLRDIRQNFLVGGDGRVYEGRGWETSPKLPQEFDPITNESILVGFLGYFDNNDLPEAMKLAANTLIEYGVSNKMIEDTYVFHNLMSKTLPQRIAT